MEKNSLPVNYYSYEIRNRRVLFWSRSIFIVLLTAVLFPVVFSIILFVEMHSMQKQLGTLIKVKATFNSTGLESRNSKFVRNNGQSVDAQNKKSGRREVYLTFDDGPSKYTPELLKLLKQYNVKATFFVIGKTDDISLKMYSRIVDEGHTLAMHSYSHEYKDIYASLEAFKEDFEKIRNLIFDTTGCLSTIYRFPGGSGNSISKYNVKNYIKFLNDNSVVYYDWNVLSGDATGVPLTVDQMYLNVMDGIKKNDKSIVLMHDTNAKKYTIMTLKKILNIITKEDIDILPLREDVPVVQQVKLSSVVAPEKKDK